MRSTCADVFCHFYVSKGRHVARAFLDEELAHATKKTRALHVHLSPSPRIVRNVSFFRPLHRRFRRTTLGSRRLVHVSTKEIPDETEPLVLSYVVVLLSCSPSLQTCEAYAWPRNGGFQIASTNRKGSLQRRNAKMSSTTMRQTMWMLSVKDSSVMCGRNNRVCATRRRRMHSFLLRNNERW